MDQKISDLPAEHLKGTLKRRKVWRVWRVLGGRRHRNSVTISSLWRLLPLFPLSI